MAALTLNLRRLVIALLCLFGFFAANATAQVFPNRPITLTSPYTPGSNTDIVLREIAAGSSKSLGQPVVFESRPGANNRLGINALRKTSGDGYLMTVVSDSLIVLQPLADPEFRLESGKDYSPIAFSFEFPLVLVSPSTLPFRDIKGLISYAKDNPNKLNLVTSSTGIFIAERFRQATGVDVVMVPYKGTAGQALQDLVASRVHLNFTGSVAAPFISAGKLAAIATTGGQRWSAFSDVPTLEEQGVPVSTTTWFGFVAPPKTPSGIIARLNAAINGAVVRPEVLKLLQNYGMTTGRIKTPEEFARFIQAELNAWAPVIQKAGIKLE